MVKTHKGYFKPKNPKKYLGDVKNIVYRSWWECKYMMNLDDDDEVINWASEEFPVLYQSPIDNKVHRYFPDFFIRKKIKNQIKEFVVEIKPKKQTMPPILKENARKSNKYYKMEIITYAINKAKWLACDKFCKDKGWEFQILTEKELGL